MSLVKYRVKEVAADFGMQPKEIAAIVGIYFEKPKSNTQVLTEEQLNAVFDHITQHHQIESIAQVFAVAPAPKKEGEGETAPAAPRDFAGIDRTNVTRELFESVTDEELPIFAKNVLGLDVEMNPSIEDKASIDLAAWRADVRVQVGKQVTKALRKQALTGSNK